MENENEPEAQREAETAENPVDNGNLTDASESVVKKKLVRNYDEEEMFDLYFVAGGKIEKMLELKDQLPVELQNTMPAKTTLYELQRARNWKDRLKKLQDSMREQLEEEVGMTMYKINSLASMVMGGYYKKVFDAMREQRYKNFSWKEFESIWKIQRTERGLTTSIVQSNEIKDYDGGLQKIVEEEGGEGMRQFLENLDPETSSKLLKAFEKNDDDESKQPIEQPASGGEVPDAVQPDEQSGEAGVAGADLAQSEPPIQD